MVSPRSIRPNGLRVLLVEDQTIVREVLVEWMRGEAGWDVVGACATLAQARERLAQGGVDVVVLDVQLPDGSGLDLLPRDSASSGPAVVVVTAHEQPWLVREVAARAVLGVVMKGAPLADLRRAVELAAAGEVSYCRRTSELLRQHTRAGLPHEQLTPREIEILREVVAGRTSREIAEELGIREKTVQNHRANLMDKLGIHDVAGLVRYAMAQGITRTVG